MVPKTIGRYEEDRYYDKHKYIADKWADEVTNVYTKSSVLYY